MKYLAFFVVFPPRLFIQTVITCIFSGFQLIIFFENNCHSQQGMEPLRGNQ